MLLIRDRAAACVFEVLSRLTDTGVLLEDAAGVLEAANVPAPALLGCTDEDELRRRWPALRPVFQPQRTSHSDFTAELGISRETRKLACQSFSLGKDAREGRLIVIKDPHALDALERELMFASRMRSLVHEHRMLSHDLRAPLNAMQLSTELLSATLSEEGHSGEPHSWQRHVSVIREELGRLHRLLETSLDCREPMELRRETFDLRMMADELVRLLTPQARKRKIAIKMDLPEGPAIVSGVRDWIRQALLNVVMNRLDSIPGSGQVEMAVTTHDARVVITLLDAGPPVSKEAAEAMSQLIISGGESAVGFQLYVARRISEWHGGQMKLDSPHPGSTRFTIVLPSARAAS